MNAQYLCNRIIVRTSSRIKVLTYEGDHSWLLEFLRTLSAAVGQVVQPEPAATQPATRRTRGVRSGTASGAKPMPVPAPAAGRAPAPRGWNLTLAVTGSRVDANLVDARGATVARGTGSAIDWPGLAPVVGAIHDNASRVPVGSIGAAPHVAAAERTCWPRASRGRALRRPPRAR